MEKKNMFPKNLTPEVKNMLLAVVVTSLVGSVAVLGPVILMILGVDWAPWPILAIFTSGVIAMGLRKNIDFYVGFIEFLMFIGLAVSLFLMFARIGNGYTEAMFIYGATFVLTVANYSQALWSMFGPEVKMMDYHVAGPEPELGN